jgi:hypothetical protein
MKKLITLLFAAAFVTAASAQSGYRHGTDSRGYNNSYQTSPSSSYGQDSYGGYHSYDNRFDRQRAERIRRAERMRYEMMMRRNRARYYHQRSYDRYPYYGNGYSNRSGFRLSIGF